MMKFKVEVLKIYHLDRWFLFNMYLHELSIFYLVIL